jgi:shikimate kinase
LSVLRVTLVGFMGAGKSTVGRELARRLALPFVDLDDRVEAEAGRDIPTLFAQQGEATFRALERTVLLRALGEPLAVLATGGGAVADPDNRAAMRRASTVVWLDVRFEIARERLQEQGARRRPLVEHLGWARLAQLHRVRRQDYAAAAHLHLHADQHPPAQLARSIQSTLRAMVREDAP